jgi:predicted site-specific integrase-resolvase
MRNPETATQTLDRWTRTGQLSTPDQIRSKLAVVYENMGTHWEARQLVAYNTERTLYGLLQDLALTPRVEA